MSEALNRLGGVTAEVATTDADGPERYDPKNWRAANTQLHLFARDGSERYKSSTDLEEWLRARVADYDVVETHGLWSFPAYAARRAAIKQAKPLVIRPCGMLSDYTWTRKPLLKYTYWCVRERANVRAAAAFHCTSEGEAAEVRKHRAARGLIHVILNGVDKAAWTELNNPTELRRICGSQAENMPIVLFLSRLHPKKGLTDFLLPALASSTPRAFLAVVGGPDENAPGYMDEIRNAVRHHDLANRVAFLGPVAASRRWAMFDGADAFALPSHSENFGIVVAEAMARGCPVLVTDGVQSSEHVERAQAGIVTRAETAGVAEGLTKILGGDRAAYGERGRAYARDHFDWDRIAGQLLDLYRELQRTER